MFVFLLNIPRSIFAQDSSKSKIPADAAICWRFQVLFKLRSSYWSWKWGNHCHKKMRSLSSVIGPNVILQFDHLFEWSSRNFNKSVFCSKSLVCWSIPRKKESSSFMAFSVIMTLLTNIRIILGITIMIYLWSLQV